MKNKIKTPNDVEVSRHVINESDIRFTVPNGTHPETKCPVSKLVAWFKNGQFVWFCNGYSA